MDYKYFTTKGTLVRCCKSDLIAANGAFINNKMFFIKEISAGKFISHYLLPSNTYASGDVDNDNDYECVKQEIEFLLGKNLIYKLSDLHHHLDFHFHLYIRTAGVDDLFYTSKHLMINTIYYLFDNAGSVIGPNQITINDDPNKFLELIVKGLILVPIKKQKFEQITIAKAS